MVSGTNPVSLGEITIEAGAVHRIPLQPYLEEWLQTEESQSPSWGDGSRVGSAWGSARLDAENLKGLTAWIATENSAEGLSVSSLFTFSEAGTPTARSLWWAPTPTSRVYVALQNVSTEPLTLVATHLISGQQLIGSSVTLEPGQGALRSLESLIPPTFSDASAGAILFDSIAGAGRVIGRTIVFDEATEYSVSAALMLPEFRQSNSLETPGGPVGPTPPSMGFPEGTSLFSRLVLGNTTAANLTVEPTVHWLKPDGSFEVLAGNTVNLLAREVRVLNLVGDVLPPMPEPFKGLAGLRLEHTGPPEALLADALSTDATLRHSFLCPFFDISNAATQKVAVSVDLSGAKNTMLISKNTLDEPVDYAFSISYQDSSGQVHRYESLTTTLPAHGLAAVDIRALRDQQVSDRNGNLLPTDLKLATASAGATEPVLLGIDPTYDPEAGTSLLCEELCWGPSAPHLCGWMFTIPPLPPMTVQIGVYRVDPAFMGGQGCFRGFDDKYRCRYLPCPGNPPPCATRTTIVKWTGGGGFVSAPYPGTEIGWLNVNLFFGGSCLKLRTHPLLDPPC